MENKVYLLLKSKGIYEDYHEWVEEVFEDYNDAKEYADDFDKCHSKLENAFDIDMWREIRDIYDTKYGEEDEEIWLWKGKEAWQLNEEEREQYDEYCDDLLAKRYLEILKEKGVTDATYEQVLQQLQYDDQEYEYWHDCEIKEMVVIPSTNNKSK